jgi:hypothetical protein
VGKWTCRATAAGASGSMDGLRGKRAPGIVVDGWRRRVRAGGSGAGSSSCSYSSCRLSVLASTLLSPSVEASSSRGGVSEGGGGGVPW